MTPNHPIIIQGGMGVGVSNWRLAKAVSRLGQLGVVSGTGINTVLTRRLQDGDVDGDVRRAMKSYPEQDFIQEVLGLYFRRESIPRNTPYKPVPLPSLRPSLFFQKLNTLGAFVEVTLAREDHVGIVGINLLEKLQTSNLSALFGAMLAGVDYVLMGAGVPREIPGILDTFSRFEKASMKVSLAGAKCEKEFSVSFDPKEIFPNVETHSLKRPRFLAIISSATLGLHLKKKSTGEVDGFIVEGPTAGGHNAPPRGPLRLDDFGEPIYSEKDIADLKAIRDLGLPFWLAGSFCTAAKLREALDLGAAGVQIGTAFAFCEESGLSEKYKEAIIKKWSGEMHSTNLHVFTDPYASPTNFPFKVVPLEETLSEKEIYLKRPRKCDLGYLRQIVPSEDGKVLYRCPAEPVNDYVKKGGKIEDTTNRKCLCNALMANVGLGQVRAGDYQEPALITAGDDLNVMSQYLQGGKTRYTAKDVVQGLLHL